MTNLVRIRAVLDDKVSGSLDRIRDRFDRLGKSKGAMSILQGVGLGAGAAAFTMLGQAAGAAGDFIGDSINKARDMAETLSKSRTVFGAASAEVEAFGNQSATSMGIAKQATIEATATLGNLFLGIGQTQEKSAELSMGMVKLAGDLASFNNIDPTVALEKLRAGLTGEAEPLRAVGVFLTEAKVKAKAMQMGLGKAHGELTEGEKILARYQIILDETGTAQGDFARTSEGLANKQRQALATVEDKMAELGQAFQPMALQVTEWQLDFVYGIGVVTDALGDLGPAINDFTESWSGVPIATEKAMTGTAQHAGKIADDVATMADDVDRSTDDAAASFDDMVKGFKSSAQDALDNAYGPIIDHNKLLGVQVEIAAAQRVLASSTATAAEKRDARDALAELGKDQAEYVLKLAKAGQTGSGAYKNAVESLKTSIASATGPTKKYLQEAYDWILKVEGAGKVIPINFVASWGNMGQAHPDHRASGGPASGLTWVGERGPELVSLPSGSHVFSTPQSMAMTGGGVSEVHTHIYLDGRQIAESVDRHNAENLQRAPVWGGRY